ncbi:minichromosome maintenance protein MCM [Halobaculum marinum]|uniref:DNA helicase n=1 Tax=Halobaculum marinum TaxID=3031996 RepID=A0ABD5WR58_9EURY|nr:minichromosome maintenance protein MCM [Halobaculum sp. DT55]
MNGKNDGIERLGRWLRNEHMDALAELAQQYPNESRTFALDWHDLARWDESLADRLLGAPDDTLEEIEEAIRVVDLPVDLSMSRVNVRVHNLPESSTFVVGELDPTEHVGELVALEGQVTQRTGVSPKVTEGAFECLRCGTMTYVPQPPYGNIRQPNNCQGCEEGGFFRLNEGQSSFEDYQKIRLQQPPETAMGDTEHIDVHWTDDITGEGDLESGGRLTVVGKFSSVWTGKVVFDTTIHGNQYIPEEEAGADYSDERFDAVVEDVVDSPDPLERLCQSFAPNFEAAGPRDKQVVRALVLQLIGGWAKTGPDGRRHRGDSHIYLLGDPGVGKTVLLQAAFGVVPRGAMTDGTGASEAGLTAAIVKNDFSDEQWSIAAGTLVRANGGLAVVDELDKGDTSDLDALHTALESQTVHVDKAGKNASLPAETALLAAGNPTGGHFDPTKDFAEQVDFQSPLLSRFDLILRMQAREDYDLILQVAEKMTRARTAAAKYELGEELTPEERGAIEGDLSAEELSAYIARAKEVKPRIRSEEVEREVSAWFAETKTSLPERYTDAMGDGDYDGPPLPITARKQVALMRLAEASARARLDDTVRMHDIDRVKPLIERSLADIGIAPKNASAFGGGDAEGVDAGSVGL